MWMDENVTQYPFNILDLINLHSKLYLKFLIFNSLKNSFERINVHEVSNLFNSTTPCTLDKSYKKKLLYL